MKIDKSTLRKRRPKLKDSMINIKVEKSLRAWLKEKNYSPTRIFYEAVKSLGWRK